MAPVRARPPSAREATLREDSHESLCNPRRTKHWRWPLVAAESAAAVLTSLLQTLVTCRPNDPLDGGGPPANNQRWRGGMNERGLGAACLSPSACGGPSRWAGPERSSCGADTTSSG